MAASHQGIDIQDIINTWFAGSGANRRYEMVLRGARVHPPWEGWLQCELAGTIIEEYGNTLSVDRDDFVYDGGNEASYIEVMNGASRTIIELKCERGNTPATSVVEGVIENRQRLKQGLYARYRPAKCLSVGFAVSEEAIQAIRNHELYAKGELKGFFCPNNKVFIAFLECMAE